MKPFKLNILYSFFLDIIVLFNQPIHHLYLFSSYITAQNGTQNPPLHLYAITSTLPKFLIKNHILVLQIQRQVNNKASQKYRSSLLTLRY